MPIASVNAPTTVYIDKSAAIQTERREEDNKITQEQKQILANKEAFKASLESMHQRKEAQEIRNMADIRRAEKLAEQHRIEAARAADSKLGTNVNTFV